MAESTSDAFLSGQGIAVDLHNVETELTRLWGPAAEGAGGSEVASLNVTRVVLANLVVEGCAGSAARLTTVLDAVSTRYPCRTIVLCRTDDAERKVAAEISALCHLPAPGLPQVCSERIVLRAGPQAGDMLPGAVRPLLEADLPFVLWWTDDPRKDEALFRDLADECSRLILDLPDPAADVAALRLGLDPKLCPYSRDAAWFGLTRWRELNAQFFDPPGCRETYKRINSVQIEALSPSIESPPRLAVWLAAWFGGQLGWTPLGRPKRSNGGVDALFRGPTGDIAVTIVSEHAPGLQFAQLTATTVTTQNSDGPGTFRLRRLVPGSAEIRVEADSPTSCALPRVVLAPELDPSRRVSAALESSRRDPPFERARPLAFWMLEG